MAILEPIVLYCERTLPGVLDEPWNLTASLVFLPVGLGIYRAATGNVHLRIMAIGCLVLGLCLAGLHMWPSRLTIGLTLAAFLGLMLGAFHGINRGIVGLSPKVSMVATLLILPFGAISLPLVVFLKGGTSSLAYIALPILFLGYAAVMRDEKPDVARGFFVAALIVGVGLIARTLDLPLCGRVPQGTHFLWVLSGAALQWHLMRVMRPHLLAGQAADR